MPRTMPWQDIATTSNHVTKYERVFPKTLDAGQVGHLRERWATARRRRRPSTESAKRYAPCQFAHTCRRNDTNRNVFKAAAKVSKTTPGKRMTKRYGDNHFRDTSILKQHVGITTVMQPRSCRNMPHTRNNIKSIKYIGKMTINSRMQIFIKTLTPSMT